jgi:uncharacterized membrane protein YgcG
MTMTCLKGLLFAVLVPCGVAFASAALALAPCDQVVVDTAGALHNIPGIEAAAAKLAAATGAEVRVRIEPSFRPDANLDFHVEAITDNVCKAWTNFNQHRRENLILFWVTNNPDSKGVGLYYGDMWRADLDRDWPKMLSGKIIPALKVGNYDGAIIAGLNAVSDTIIQAEQPATAGGGGTSSAGCADNCRACTGDYRRANHTDGLDALGVGDCTLDCGGDCRLWRQSSLQSLYAQST